MSKKSASNGRVTIEQTTEQLLQAAIEKLKKSAGSKKVDVKSFGLAIGLRCLQAAIANVNNFSALDNTLQLDVKFVVSIENDCHHAERAALTTAGTTATAGTDDDTMDLCIPILGSNVCIGVKPEGE
ncbi:MAG: hypothetical protein AB1489_37015 [Acidobacteriota bacterium]